MTTLAESLKRLYVRGKIKIEQIDESLSKKIITEEEHAYIIS